MTKKLKIKSERSFEQKVLMTITVFFLAVIVMSWVYAMKLRQTILTNSNAISVESQALIEVEKIRNVIDSEVDAGRAYFLLGSKSLYDERKKAQETFRDSLSNFERHFSLPQIPEVIKHIESLDQQEQDVFDQGMKFREKNTESKIVGQFYQSKAKSIHGNLNDALDEISHLETAAIDQARTHAREAALGAEVKIPRGMTWFTASMVVLFLGMALLIFRLLKERVRHVAERGRLFEETKKALQARDEVISAVSQDLKEPLDEISKVAKGLPDESTELIKNHVAAVDGLIKDISDQAKAGTGTMILRLDQLGVNDVLDDARHLLQPMAKQYDVRLQIDSTNPPILAFFDRERVVRVLSNLVGNAIKTSPKHSRVLVKVRSDQQFVYTSVEDSNASTVNLSEQDSGIGLAIAKTIVEAHGGTLSYQTNAGAGHIYTFSLPRRRPVGAFLVKPTATIKYISRSEPILDY